MKILTLERYCLGSFGTFGTMMVNGRLMQTVEPPWLNNMVGISCVPPGSYALALDSWRGRYDAPILLDVPGRSQIQIHPANLPSQLRGCIAVGWERGFVNGEWAIIESKDAFDHLMSYWPFDGITIKNKVIYEP